MKRSTFFASIGFVSLFSLFACLVPSSHAADKKAEVKAVAKETIEALDAGKNTKMVARLTDLETAWDAKEEELKKRHEKTWTVIDKTLDKGISALRSSHTDLAKGKAALQVLIKLLEQATKA